MLIQPETPPLDPALLHTFLSVVGAGRISAAAKVMHLSQPAVTAQIRKLEESLGTPLFIRSVHGVSPTAAGTKLIEYARSMQRLLEDAVTNISVLREIGGELVVAASTTIAAHVLPPLLAEFRASHGVVTFRVLVGNTEDVIEHVRNGRAPIGLVEGHPRAAGLRLEPFVDDEIVPVVGRDSSFRIRVASDLIDVPILWREAGSGTRSVVERALVKAGVRRRSNARDTELGSTEAIVSGAMAGLGVAFVSRWSIRAHLAAGLVRIVPGLDLVVRRTFRWAFPGGGVRGTAGRFHAFARRSPPVLA